MGFCLDIFSVFSYSVYTLLCTYTICYSYILSDPTLQLKSLPPHYYEATCNSMRVSLFKDTLSAPKLPGTEKCEAAIASPRMQGRRWAS